jgi:2-methylcitrate dehydratase
MNIHTLHETSITKLAAWTLANEAAYRSELTLRQAKLLVLDTIGCALAGSTSETTVYALDLARDLGGNPECTIIGVPGKTSILNAVFANGVLVRAHDFNDVTFQQKDGKLSVGGHCSDNIPVALAAAEKFGSSGRAMLESIAMGYELFGRLRDVMRFTSTWDNTSISGLVAAAMAGRLMGLDEVRQAHGLALAAIRCATPKIVRWGSISAAKNLANALVAQSGVQAALMAAKGLTGPLEVLDHAGGIPAIFDPAVGFDGLWAPVGEPPRIMTANVKSFPCIGTAQALIFAALDAHKKLGPRIGEIERIEVVMANLPMVKAQQAERTRRYPQTHEEADHSFTFLPCVVLSDGELTLRQYENERWMQPSIRAMIEKVDLLTSDDLNARAPGSMPGRLRLILRGGADIVSECLYPPGHSFPEKGLDSTVVEGKFREVSRVSIAAREAGTIVDLVSGLHTLAPVGHLLDQLRQPRGIEQRV